MAEEEAVAGEVVQLNEDAAEDAEVQPEQPDLAAEEAKPENGAEGSGGTDPTGANDAPSDKHGDVHALKRVEAATPAAEEFKAFVGGISWEMDENELVEAFAKYNPTGAEVMRDRMTGRSRGFGFMWFPTEESRTEAIAELHKTKLRDREISVTPAIPQSQTAPGTPAAALGGSGGYRGSNSRGRYGDQGGDRSGGGGYRGGGYDRHGGGYGDGYGAQRGYGGGYDRRDMGGYRDYSRGGYDSYAGYGDRYAGGYDRYGAAAYGQYGAGGYERGYDDRYGGQGGYSAGYAGSRGGGGGGGGGGGYGAERRAYGDTRSGYGDRDRYSGMDRGGYGGGSRGYERPGPYSRPR